MLTPEEKQKKREIFDAMASAATATNNEKGL